MTDYGIGNEYAYRLKMRPPAPGALPRYGLLRTYSNDMWIGERHYWGKAVYDHELTEAECEQYDLEFCGALIDGKKV